MSSLPPSFQRRRHFILIRPSVVLVIRRDLGKANRFSPPLTLEKPQLSRLKAAVFAFSAKMDKQNMETIYWTCGGVVNMVKNKMVNLSSNDLVTLTG